MQGYFQLVSTESRLLDNWTVSDERARDFQTVIYHTSSSYLGIPVSFPC